MEDDILSVKDYLDSCEYDLPDVCIPELCELLVLKDEIIRKHILLGYMKDTEINLLSDRLASAEELSRGLAKMLGE